MPCTWGTAGGLGSEEMQVAGWGSGCTGVREGTVSRFCRTDEMSVVFFWLAQGLMYAYVAM